MSKSAFVILDKSLARILIEVGKNETTVVSTLGKRVYQYKVLEINGDYKAKMLRWSLKYYLEEFVPCTNHSENSDKKKWSIFDLFSFRHLLLPVQGVFEEMSSSDIQSAYERRIWNDSSVFYTLNVGLLEALTMPYLAKTEKGFYDFLSSRGFEPNAISGVDHQQANSKAIQHSAEIEIFLKNLVILHIKHYLSAEQSAENKGPEMCSENEIQIKECLSRINKEFYSFMSKWICFLTAFKEDFLAIKEAELLESLFAAQCDKHCRDHKDTLYGICEKYLESLPPLRLYKEFICMLYKLNDQANEQIRYSQLFAEIIAFYTKSQQYWTKIYKVTNNEVIPSILKSLRVNNEEMHEYMNECELNKTKLALLHRLKQRSSPLYKDIVRHKLLDELKVENKKGVHLQILLFEQQLVVISHGAYEVIELNKVDLCRFEGNIFLFYYTKRPETGLFARCHKMNAFYLCAKTPDRQRANEFCLKMFALKNDALEYGGVFFTRGIELKCSTIVSLHCMSNSDDSLRYYSGSELSKPENCATEHNLNTKHAAKQKYYYKIEEQGKLMSIGRISDPESFIAALKMHLYSKNKAALMEPNELLKINTVLDSIEKNKLNPCKWTDGEEFSKHTEKCHVILRYLAEQMDEKAKNSIITSSILNAPLNAKALQSSNYLDYFEMIGHYDKDIMEIVPEHNKEAYMKIYLSIMNNAKCETEELLNLAFDDLSIIFGIFLQRNQYFLISPRILNKAKNLNILELGQEFRVNIPTAKCIFRALNHVKKHSNEIWNALSESLGFGSIESG
ncbi:hypothetical protein ENBRE01_0478 [Enteropsectra breve]|nr:hypothetical protein ENBRE01_0478 [Enteropsectra breve]